MLKISDFRSTRSGNLVLLSVAYSVVKVLTIYFTTPLEIINGKKTTL